MRAVVDLLLHVLVPSPDLETRTGRFVVGELITCNVLLPLVDKLSDPDWLNLLLIEIFTKSSLPLETVEPEPMISPQPKSPAESKQDVVSPLQQVADASPINSEVPLQSPETEPVKEADLGLSEPSAGDMVDSEDVEFPHNLAEEDETSRAFLRPYMRGSKSNPFYQENDSDLDSPLTDYRPSSTDSMVVTGQDESLFDQQKECSTTTDNNNEEDLELVCPSLLDRSCPHSVLSNSELVQNPNGSSLSSVRTPEEIQYSISSLHDLDREGGSPPVNPNRELLLTGMGNPNELTVGSPSQGCSPMPTFSFEPLSSPEGPVMIQNLRITGTITAKEHRGTGSHPYTLYTIKVRLLCHLYWFLASFVRLFFN